MQSRMRAHSATGLKTFVDAMRYDDIQKTRHADIDVRKAVVDVALNAAGAHGRVDQVVAPATKVVDGAGVTELEQLAAALQLGRPAVLRHKEVSVAIEQFEHCVDWPAKFLAGVLVENASVVMLERVEHDQRLPVSRQQTTFEHNEVVREQAAHQAN